MRKAWTEEDINVIKELYTTKDDRYIADILGRTPGAVVAKRKKLGLHCKFKYSFDDIRDAFDKVGLILLSDESEYVNKADNLRCMCKIHKDAGELKISYGHVIEGKGCRLCGLIRSGLSRRRDYSVEDMISLCNRHGFTYIGNERKLGKLFIKYICRRHPEEGVQEMAYHNMRRDIHGCKKCGREDRPLSSGEIEVKKYLEENGYNYLREHTFQDCTDKGVLPFDFYLPELNIAIEFDGEHHYYPVNFNGMTDEKALENHLYVKAHDKIKNNYCKDNGINLIRIPYTERGSVGDFLCSKLEIDM